MANEVERVARAIILADLEAVEDEIEPTSNAWGRELAEAAIAAMPDRAALQAELDAYPKVMVQPGHKPYPTEQRRITPAEVRRLIDGAPEADEREVQWEIWQDDMMVASSTDEGDARHYLAVYSLDGPATLMRAETFRERVASAPAEGEGHGQS